MWIIATLAGLVVLIFFALSIPLNLSLHVDVPGKPKFRTKIRWFFGLVNKEITKKEEQPIKKQKTIKPKRKPKEKVIRVKVLLQILRVKGLLKQVKSLLRDTLKRVRLDTLEVDFKLGLDDPADTGLIFAFIGPAACLFNAFLPDRVKIQASFAGEAVLEGSLDIALRFVPWLVVIPLLRFIFSPPGFRVTKILLVAKCKRLK